MEIKLKDGTNWITTVFSSLRDLLHAFTMKRVNPNVIVKDGEQWVSYQQVEKEEGK